MFDQADREIETWIESVLGAVKVIFAAPGGSQQGSGVNIHLMALDHKPPPTRSKTLPPLTIILRYLITAFAADDRKSHTMLGKLVVNALSSARFEAEVAPLDPATWRAFGVAPRPCFVLCVPLNIERPTQRAKPVTKPPVIEKVPLEPLSGRVFGPSDTPIADARIEVVPQGPSTQTDYRGRFELAPLPGGAGFHELRVTARDKQRLIKVARENDGEPLVVRFDNLEG